MLLTIVETVTTEYRLEDTPANRALIAELRERMWNAGKMPVRVLGMRVAPMALPPGRLEDLPVEDTTRELTRYTLQSHEGFEEGTHGLVERR